MSRRIAIGQIILRIALGIGFLLPVMDRLGWLGAPGSGVVATIAEAVFAITLIIGLKTRQAALGAAILTLIFGRCMALFLGLAAPFNYPVFVFTGACLLLSGIPEYKWSIDELRKPLSSSTQAP